MDNITHSLVGFAEADLILGFAAKKKKTLPAAAIYTAAVAANNLPDLDIFLSSLTPGKLGYLLHHRGYTHTLLGAIPLAVLLVVLIQGWRMARRKIEWKESIVLLLLVSLGGIWLHILMDAFNSYGVHPFWPVDNHWYYGDTLFIVEPWLSAVLLPLVMAQKSKWLSVPASLLWAAVFGLVWFSGWVPIPMAAIITATGLCVAGLCYKAPRAHRGAIGAAASFVVILCFAGTSVATRRSFEAYYAATFPSIRLDDLVISPLPANALCWIVTSVEYDRKTDEVISRRATFTPFPQVMDVTRCRMPGQLADRATASEPGVIWADETRMRRPQLVAQTQKSCEIQAFMRFSRVPFVDNKAGGLIVGDLRFRWRGTGGFAELKVGSATACPRNLPPWVAPREKLLR